MKLFTFFLPLYLSLVFSSQADGKNFLPHLRNDTAFLMAVEDVFNISGFGVMVTGTIESGSISPGARLEVKGKGDKVFTVAVASVSINLAPAASERKGDKVTLNLKGVSQADIQRGMVVASPGSIQTYKLIEASVKLLSKEKGGSSFPLKDQSIQLLIRTEGASAKALLSGAELKPGESATLQFQVNDATPFRLNDTIAIKLYGKIIGNGVVTKLVN